MSSDIVVSEPSATEIKAWWDWASKFTYSNSPFEPGWGGGKDDRNHQRQPANIRVYCVSCTAGYGGSDSVRRPLRNARNSGKDLLMPVFIAGSDNRSEASQLLGQNPRIKLLINGTPRHQSLKLIETSVGPVDFVVDNSFGEIPGNYRDYYSVGYWAKISLNGVQTLEFGGEGGQRIDSQIVEGQKTSTSTGQFSTTVTYS